VRVAPVHNVHHEITTVKAPSTNCAVAMPPSPANRSSGHHHILSKFSWSYVLRANERPVKASPASGP
jgi:hypothetical protein